MFTLTFTKVFEDTGEGQNGPWKRWTYLTSEGQRFATYKPELGNLRLHVPLHVEADVKNGKHFIRSAVPAEGQNPVQETQNGSEAVKTAPVVSGGYHSDPGREQRIHRQTAAKVAAELLRYFPEEEQNLEAFFLISEKLVDYFGNGLSE